MLIDAEALLRRAAALGAIGRYQLEAALQSAHVHRCRTGETNWLEVVQLYDALLALLPDTGKFVVLRVPYPIGFYAKGMDGRIDDPNGGWKGRALYSNYGTHFVWHIEGGKGTKGKIVKFQVRPDPLDQGGGGDTAGVAVPAAERLHSGFADPGRLGGRGVVGDERQRDVAVQGGEQVQRRRVVDLQDGAQL